MSRPMVGTSRREFLRLCALALAPLRIPTRSRVGVKDDAARLRAFRARPKAVQEKAVADLLEVLEKDDDPWLRSVFAAVERGRALATGKNPPGWQPRKAHVEEVWRYAELGFPLRREYLWGHRMVREVEKRPPFTVGDGRDKLSLEAGSHAEWLVAPLRGFVPDLDLAIAAIQYDLDTARDADRFQCFLESWRNGEESFYAALDRTAGTDKSVFFFDAMLGEFAQLFGDEFGKDKELNKSLQKKHDAVLHAFLAYRQYRALREAASFALVIPIEAALPAHLARYEARTGGYSFRDDLAILLQLDGGSIVDVAHKVADATPPLPRPLWSTEGRYPGLESFQEGFGKRIESALQGDQSGSTDGWRTAWHDRSVATAARIRKRTAEVLDAAGITA